jgi:hypothetical protein
MKSIIAVLGAIIIGLIVLTFNNSKKLITQINKLEQENVALRKKLSETPPPPPIPSNRTLDVYNKSFLMLMKEHPDCARNFAMIMSTYE